MTSFADSYFEDLTEIVSQIDRQSIESLALSLKNTANNNGRLFFLGVGGSSGNCSHAVNDFRKICGIEAYAPTDNVSELTARINDDGWECVFSAWLKTSRLCSRDAVFVMSVGGGCLERNISPNIVHALEYVKSVGATIYGIVGRDGGYTKKVGDHVVVIPTVNSATITPHTEALQSVVWHLLVSHPLLSVNATKWETATSGW